MTVISGSYLGLCLLVLLSMRLLPRTVAQAIHLFGSLWLWALLISDTASLALATAFISVPYLLYRVLGMQRNLTIPLVIFIQFTGFIWLRRYLAIVPAWADLTWIHHGLQVTGISYVTLRQIDWLLAVDLERQPRPRLVDYLNYVCSLFAILAGPIARFNDFHASIIRKPERLDPDTFLAVLNRFVNGLIKVGLIAPLLGDLTSLQFVREQEYSTVASMISFYGYPFYIYFNFAGYCDIVIALARIAGIDLPENFNLPFLATNVQDFWQRWHVSLSNWIRDYIFYPLTRLLIRRLRVFPAYVSTSIAVVVCFVAIGLWHGPTSGYLIFGLLHGLGALMVRPYVALLERLLSEDGLRLYREHLFFRFIRWLVFFHFLCASTMLFERTPAEALSILSGGL